MSEFKSSVVRDEKKNLILVKNAIAFWCDIEEAQAKYGSTTGETEFSLKVLVTEEAVDALEDLCVNKEFTELKSEYKREKDQKKYGKYLEIVKEYEEKGITLYLGGFSQKGVSSKGKDMFVSKLGPNPKVPFTAKIGNGSIVNFRIYTYKGEGPSAGKLNTSLNAVQCINWVEYVESGPLEEEALGDVGFETYDADEADMPTADTPDATVTKKSKPVKTETPDDGEEDPFGDI